MHSEYKRIVESSDKAILFIHGILGTPNHFDFLVPLVPEDMSVYNLLLDGHGKGVKDFAKTSMKKWEQQVTATVNELAKNHTEIHIVAHSLGCLLAIEQAVGNSKITKLFLLAVPLKLFLKPKMFLNSLRVWFDKIDPENKELMAAKKCYGIRDDKNPLHYIGWIPRFLELFSKIKKTRKTIKFVKTPCVAHQSARDEMVSKQAETILQKNPMIRIVELKNSGHYYYENRDLAIVKEKFIDFIS